MLQNEFEKCGECEGTAFHDIQCSKSDVDKSHLLFSKLENIRQQCRARTDIIITFDDEKILFQNKSEWYLEGLKGDGWNDFSVGDLKGRRIELHYFFVEWNDENEYGDLWCIEWFYRKFGFLNVKLQFKNELQLENAFMKKMKSLYE